MNGVGIQPGSLNIVVSSQVKEVLNLIPGKTYQGKVLDVQGPDRVLVQIGGQQVLAENLAGIRPGEMLKLLVKGSSEGKIILKIVPGQEKATEDSSEEPVSKLSGFLEKLLPSHDTSRTLSDKEVTLNPLKQTLELPYNLYPFDINWQNLSLKGKLEVWDWCEEGNRLETKKTWRVLVKAENNTLGPLEADLMLVNKELRVLIKVESETTKQLVERNLNQLAKTLQKAGLDLGPLVVKENLNRDKAKAGAGLDLKA